MWILSIQQQAVADALREMADPVAPVSFPDLLSLLHATKHTGSVVVHFAEGQPKRVDLGRPVTVALTR